jgi:hypothetical protein
MTKEHILSEIRRTAAVNAGVPLGQARFSTETRIKSTDWLGKYWARWSDAVQDAGFTPNELRGARSDEDLLGCLAAYVRELGRFPVANEIKLKARTDPRFPWHSTFAKFGRKAEVAARLEQYCRARGEEDVASICATVSSAATSGEDEIATGTNSVGYVYLVRHGSRREYKIGRTNNPVRREGELRTELPEALSPVHHITTDDPAGVERYWHIRFADKRKNGEWFELNADDVRSFKRWRCIY